MPFIRGRDGFVLKAHCFYERFHSMSILMQSDNLSWYSLKALEVMFSEPYVQQEQEDSDTDSDFECDTKVIGNCDKIILCKVIN